MQLNTLQKYANLSLPERPPRRAQRRTDLQACPSSQQLVLPMEEAGETLALQELPAIQWIGVDACPALRSVPVITLR